MDNNIVSAEWLSTHLNNPELVVLDATLPKVTEKNKPLSIEGIPTAIKFDLQNIFVNKNATLPNTIPTQQHFEEGVQNLGINSNHTIIIYDQHGIYSSPRAWWLFKLFGHQNVYVLDGGLSQWKFKGFDVENISLSKGLKGNFKASFNPLLFADKNMVTENLKTKKFLVVDARSAKRFYGETEEPRKDLRSGHIPYSKNLHYATLTHQNVFKTNNELSLLFKEIKKEEKPIIYSCGSGITACILALAGTQIGITNFAIYDGSWSEWGLKKQKSLQ
ncbi:MAG TPA: sulfurtransferase [Crocinitomix sp.]|nr:sulfurtransferase [Crocinitomix sp.]